jgi:hypothetical protein
MKLLSENRSAQTKGGLKMKLSVKAFALACGLIWGLGLFFLTWWMYRIRFPGHKFLLSRLSE